MATFMVSIIVILVNFLRVAQLLGVAGGRLSPTNRGRTKCWLTTNSETLYSVFVFITCVLWCMTQLELDGNIHVFVVSCASISRWVKWTTRVWIIQTVVLGALVSFPHVATACEKRKNKFTCNVILTTVVKHRFSNHKSLGQQDSHSPYFHLSPNRRQWT